MNNSMMLWLGAALVVILALAAVAIYYLVALYRLRQRQRQAATLREEQWQEQRLRLVKSIRVLAQGMLNDDLTLTEGSIRIRVLLEGLQVEQTTRDSYSAFYLLATATEHIPILEQWRKLSTKEKLRFDRQRQNLENDHREFVLDAARRILREELL